MNAITSLAKAATVNGQITKSELFRAYNRARAAIRKTGDKKAEQRLNKALGILQSRDYYQGERIAYTPTVDDCGCKDWQYRAAHKRGTLAPCKHMYAELLLAAIMRERESLDVSEWLTRQDARHALAGEY